MDCWGDGDAGSETDSCSRNRTASSIIWGLFGAGWLIATLTCVNALRDIRRARPIQLKYEPRVIIALTIGSGALSALGFTKCPSPETRILGIDLATTLLYAIVTSIVFGFIEFNPLNPAGTGIILFALQRKKKLYKFYFRIFPLLFLSTTVASFLPLISVADSNARHELSYIIPVTFATYGICTTIAISIQLYTVNSMRNDFKTALREKRREVSESQKRGIETIVESTSKIDAGIGISALFVILVCTLIAAKIEAVMLVCWVLIPLLLAVSCAWITRYAIVSRLTTIRVKERRQSGAVSVKHRQGQNSITVTASSSNQFSSQSRRHHFLHPLQLHSRTSALAPASTMPPLPFKNGSGRRFLTRVEESENEGTIVSKYEASDWAANLAMGGATVHQAHQHNQM